MATRQFVVKNKFNSSDVEKLGVVNPDKMEQLLQQDGWTKKLQHLREELVLSWRLQSLRWQMTRCGRGYGGELCAETASKHDT